MLTREFSERNVLYTFAQKRPTIALHRRAIATYTSSPLPTYILIYICIYNTRRETSALLSPCTAAARTIVSGVGRYDNWRSLARAWKRTEVEREGVHTRDNLADRSVILAARADGAILSVCIAESFEADTPAGPPYYS